MPDRALGQEYRHVLILESRDWFAEHRHQFDPVRDLVLTYDLGLKLEVEGLGGQALFVDHLADRQVMQANNYLTYQFFRDWHLDAEGKDIFTYRGVPFGFAFRIEIWNDLVFHVRTRACLERLRELSFEALFVGTQLGLVEAALNDMGLSYSRFSPSEPHHVGYFFPIHRWMDEKLRTRTFRHRFRDFFTAIHGTLISWVDQIFGGLRKPGVFIQEYYPTRQIVQRLQQDRHLRVALVHYSWAPGWRKYLTERPIPVWGDAKKFQGISDDLMRTFREHRHARLMLANGADISESVYHIFEKRVSSRITETLRTLDCIIRHMDRNPISLEILIANIGLVTSLVDCLAKSRGIPSYLIINGMLGNDYLDEGKYATYINAYSTSIKEHYFRGMNNIVCLGDPRMDAYIQHDPLRVVNRNAPTITIGASGHNNIDLNSYLAVEFDFMYDVLQAIRTLKERGVHLRVAIKVRANGYRQQYDAFVEEYFPGLVDEILDSTPMRQVLDKTDFFISIYSQTLFEASCLGIPCLYYKKDNEIIDPPFDGNSELITVGSVDELLAALEDFRSGSSRFDAFLQKSVMEKYIGPLDGGNLDRNLRYIHDMIGQRSEPHGAEIQGKLR